MGRFFKAERLQGALVIEPNSGFSETADARKIICPGGETDAKVDALNSKV
jgi:hypothetical protein